MKVAIIGFELEGKSAFEYWQEKGADITICDQDPAKKTPGGCETQLGEKYLQGLDRFDLIVRSAGVSPDKIMAANPGSSITPKITTIIEEFLRVCPSKHTIGVTGTKGKGTTSTLIARMLEAAGKQVFLAGNIGRSPFDFLADITPESWVVLELSSFQLSDIKASTHIAVCLMVVPEHLNWHSDFKDYTHAKAQLFAHQTAADIAIYYANNITSKEIAAAGPGIKIPYFAPPGALVADGQIVIGSQHICDISELQLLGAHNWQNACAAATAVWQVVPDANAIRNVLTTFTGLPHRLEFVRELGGVKYYDDSFGTAPETAIVAMQAFKAPKVIILGGSDKGAVFGKLAQAVVDNNVRKVVLIGAIGPKIEAALRTANFTAIVPGGNTMADIVGAARAAALPGDVVLLSTASASLDMFKGYKDRGEQFKHTVDAL